MDNFIDVQSVLDGCLLGDGCLELNKNAKNACFRYMSSSKEHTEYVHSFFKQYCTENYNIVKRYEYYDKRTSKTYVRYFFRTKCLPIFTIQQKRFYVNRVKIIPNDLIINNTTLLFWYIGDGELQIKSGCIKLHTNGFTKPETEFLCKNLSGFEAKSKLKCKTQYIISIPRTRVRSFLNYIGDCPINDYKHKWSFVEYKNKNIELNGMKDYSNLYESIVSDYLTGTYTVPMLHKKYNIPTKCIYYYLDSHNIKRTRIDIKRAIIQYDLNGNMIREWESGNMIVKTLGYGGSAISACCRGIRRTYKKYIWKFKPLVEADLQKVKGVILDVG